MARYELTFESELSVSPEKAWDWVTSVAGIQAELRPLALMTAPRGMTNLLDAEIELGKPLGTSFVLLFGFLPVDRSRITLVELDPGRRFLERSPMLSMRLWQHERIIEPNEDGAKITDHLTFEPRAFGPAVRSLVGVLFRHRHRVLRRDLRE